MAGGKNDKIEAVLFQHFRRRQASLKKMMILGKTEGKRKRERPNMRIDLIKEAIGMNLLRMNRVVEDRTLWKSFIHRLSGIRANSAAPNA